MTAATSLDRSALNKLVRRFEEAARDFPSVDAIVMCRPDFFKAELEHQAASLFVPLPDPICEKARKAIDEGTINWADPEFAAVDFNAELLNRTKGQYEAMAAVAEWETWIPGGRLVTDQSGEVYQYYTVRSSGGAAFWQCVIVGPRLATSLAEAIRRFTPLAHDALRLVIRGHGWGKNPESSWLIHLADRDDPLRPPGNHDPSIQPPTGRQVLRWSDKKESPPYWIPAVQAGRQVSEWWVVRFENLFLYSAIAVRKIIESGAVARDSASSVSSLGPLAKRHTLQRRHEALDEGWKIGLRSEEELHAFMVREHEDLIRIRKGESKHIKPRSMMVAYLKYRSTKYGPEVG